MAVMSANQSEGASLDQKTQTKMASEVEQKVNGVNGHLSTESPKISVPNLPDADTTAIAESPKQNSDSAPQHSSNPIANTDADTTASNKDLSEQKEAMDLDVSQSELESVPSMAPETSETKATSVEDTLMKDAERIKKEEPVKEQGANMPSGNTDDTSMLEAPGSESQPTAIQNPSSSEQPDPSNHNASITVDAEDSQSQQAREPATRNETITLAPPPSDEPHRSSKVSREREDDSIEGPATKRIRTDPPQPALAETSYTIPAPMASSSEAVPTGDAEAVTPTPKQDDWSRYGDPERDDALPTPNMVRDAKRAIAGIKKTKMGEKLFYPVWVHWPEIKDPYQQIIKNPMDFGQLEKKLKEGQYETARVLKNDLNLIYSNCCQYNGVAHSITQQTHGYVERVMEALKTAAQEKPRSHRKEIKPAPSSASKRQSEARIVTQKPRRDSQVAPVSPTAPKTPGESPSFAPAPSGLPLIRRDPSNQENKRSIVPPKHKDLEYTNKSQKKKLSGEMRYYDELLVELQSPKYVELNGPFLVPVDPVALNIPTYFQVIKKPMDLSTIQSKLDSGQYKKGKEVEGDLSLMFKNCYKFNPAGNPIHEVGKRLEEVYKQRLAAKDEWMKKHAPLPPPSKTSRKAHDSESDESETDEPEPPRDESVDVKNLFQTIKALDARVKEESDKISKELAKENPDESAVSVAQILLTTLQSQLVQEKKKLVEAKKHGAPKSKSVKGAKAPIKSSSVPSKKRDSTTAKRTTKKKVTRVQKRGEPTETHRNVITDGILSLSEHDMNTCIEIIKKDTRQTENDSGELELDINMLSGEAVWELYDIISDKLPNIVDSGMSVQEPVDHTEENPEPSPPHQVSKAPKPKKAKPMNKQEQEARIEQLKSLKAQFQRQGSGSQEPIPSVEDQRLHPDSSDEESADSEEE